jgi:predicted  nucleic acid-binding Zn-ribbon protein
MYAVTPRLSEVGIVEDDSVYVARAADREVLDLLERFDYCYMLAPRQIGKSSLRKRVAATLQQRGRAVVLVDCQSLLSASSAAEIWQYFFECLHGDLTARGVAVPDYRASLPATGPTAGAWLRYLRDLVMPQLPDGLVLFVEEVDVLKTCHCDTDAVFLTLRQLHTDRSRYADYARIGVCVIGVSREADLVRTADITPFNIARRVALRDFRRSELDAFVPVLQPVFSHPQAILDAVNQWTSGHPYMVQNLIAAAIRARQSDSAMAAMAERPDEFIAAVVNARFFGAEEDGNLAEVRRQFDVTRLRPDQIDALNQYRVLLAGRPVFVGEGPKREVQDYLRLAGLVTFDDSDGALRLRIRNRVFREKYGPAWVSGILDARSYDDLAARWSEFGGNPDFFLRGVALAEAEKWLQLQNRNVSPYAADFIGASRAHQEAQEAAQRRETETRTRLASDAEKSTLTLTLVQDDLSAVQTRASRLLRYVYAAVGLLGVLVLLGAIAGYRSVLDARNQQALNLLNSETKATTIHNDEIVLRQTQEYVRLLEAEKTTYASTAAKTETALAVAQKDAESLKKKQTELTNTRRQLKKGSQEYEKATKEIQRLGDELQRVLGEQQRLQSQLNESTSQRDALQRQVAALTEESKETARRLAAAKAELTETAQAKDKLAQQLTALQDQFSQTSRKLDDLQDSYQACSNGLQSVKTATLAVCAKLNTALKCAPNCPPCP